MAHGENNGGPYTVGWSAQIASAVRHFQHQANQEGRGELVLEAIRRMWERLRLEPTRTGDPVYRLPALRMQVRVAVIPPLLVHFGVCEDEPVVIIKGIQLLPMRPT